jgi:pyruvate,orthophosphate dikinase
MDWAISEGRKTRPALEVGICGEHGGDPSSIEWCHIIGNNYVSCSPFRVPIARLAAAHAALKHRPAKKTTTLKKTVVLKSKQARTTVKAKTAQAKPTVKASTAKAKTAVKAKTARSR